MQWEKEAQRIRPKKSAKEMNQKQCTRFQDILKVNKTPLLLFCFVVRLQCLHEGWPYMPA